MDSATLYNLISVIVIPFIIGILKKVKLSSKFAPLAAFVIACGLVGVGKLVGITLDVNSIADIIIKGLATAGIAVLGYDQVKKLTEPVK